jgi:3,4-dihydroxy 2-butanone 4-phosphate synthase/GTP cyclohydrolase II
MRLIDYLEREGISRSDFARSAGISPAMVTLLCQGSTWVSSTLARRLVNATNGAVTPNDVLESLPLPTVEASP